MKKINKYKSSKISQDMEKLNPYAIIHEFSICINLLSASILATMSALRFGIDCS